MARPGDSFARVRPHALEQPARPRGEGNLLRARERRRPGLRAIVPVWGTVRGGHESRGGQLDPAGLPSGVTCSPREAAGGSTEDGYDRSLRRSYRSHLGHCGNPSNRES